MRKSIIGFTIAELTIVLGVIGILAAVGIVGYGSWRTKIATDGLNNDLKAAAAKLADQVNFNNSYPADQTAFNALGVVPSAGTVFSYNYSAGPNTYCLSATQNGISYYVTSASNGTVQVGLCPVWTTIAVAGGGSSSCGLFSTTTYCWGNGTNGELGNGATSNSSVPVAVSTSGVLSGKTIKSLSTGTAHSCVIASDDNAYCWGKNGYGQLGNGTTSTNSSVPVAVSTAGVLSGKTIKSISAGVDFTCAIASDNNAYCWGQDNGWGRLGNNGGGDSSSPVAVSTAGVLSGKTIKAISAGGGHACAIASDDKGYCWGYNSAGQLGNNSTSTAYVPVAVTTSGVLSGKTLKSIGSGGDFTCAIASDDKIYCWGWNFYGQLGTSDNSNSYVPAAVTTSGVLSGKTIKSLSVGQYHICVIASDDKAYCWGMNTDGRLGIGNTTNSNAPVAVSTSGVLSGKTISSIRAGTSTCALTSDSGNYCWGVNSSGQFGNGTTTSSTSPVAAATGP